MRDATSLRREVEFALDGMDGVWDVDAIVADIDADTVDDQPDFWDIAARHQLPESDEGAAFQAALSATIAARRVDRDALWTDGVVTVKARGVSRVDQQLPQQLASFTVEYPGGAMRLPAHDDGWEAVTWAAVWAAVVDARAGAKLAADGWRQQLSAASSALTRAERTVSEARVRRDRVVRDAVAAGMSTADVAKVTGLSGPGVYKIMRQR